MEGSSMSASILQTNNSLREKLQDLQEKCTELMQKVNPTRIQSIEKPLEKSKIFINTTFNLDKKKNKFVI